MTTSMDRASAKIYQFPLRGRFAANNGGEDKFAAKIAMPYATKIAFGSWYHEEAIREAEHARKN